MALVLIVEDHDDTGTLLRMLVEMCGHQAVTAKSLSEARAHCARFVFDLLLADIHLEDGESHELMQEMRARCNVRGIALSAHVFPHDRHRCYEAGFSFHLAKPVVIDELHRAIGACVSAVDDPPNGSNVE